MVDDRGETVDTLLKAIARRYFLIDCAVFTPNPSQLQHIRDMARTYRADGVIHYSLQFCGPYQVESGPVEQAIKADGLPVLRVDTDYSVSDVGQIHTQVEAFLEWLKSDCRLRRAVAPGPGASHERRRSVLKRSHPVMRRAVKRNASPFSVDLVTQPKKAPRVNAIEASPAACPQWLVTGKADSEKRRPSSSTDARASPHGDVSA